MKSKIESPDVEIIINDLQQTHHAIGRCAEVVQVMLADRACEQMSDFVKGEFNMLSGLILAIAQLSGRADDIVSKLEKYIDAGLIALQPSSDIPS
ncbi:MAG: hypothetical protein NUV51_03330 [Sulfuricaulis sp.]|nr:hypothetical protein [Sulfuricaulis sp.]